MRYLKQYLIMAILLMFFSLLGKMDLNTGDTKLSKASAVSLRDDLLKPFIAESINDRTITIAVNQKEITSEKHSIYVNEELQLMLPVKLVSDIFNCSVHIYNRSAVIEKGNIALMFKLNKPFVVIDDEELQSSSPMIRRADEYYVPAQTVLNYLEYKHEWDFEQNKMSVRDLSEGRAFLPLKYDLREKRRASKVKNQGDFGTCWAFAALSAIETSLLPKEDVSLSSDHMSLQNNFYLQQADGGDYKMGMAYLTAWQGPVYEKDDPYGDRKSPVGLKPVKHVQEIQIIEEKNFARMKEAVFKYGGVQSSIYSAMQNPKEARNFYNDEANAYCYTGEEKPNHDITIIGWDDHYPKENFPIRPAGDGAFICQNSWGEEFGERGYFYISYYDVNIGIHNVVYTSIQDTNNFDHIYQTDLCGFVGQLGYNKDSIYAANIYTAQSNEKLKAAGFYATDKDTEYKLYIVPEFRDTTSFANRRPAAEGRVANAGFYTVDFDEEFAVNAGQTYAVLLYIKTPGAIRPIAIEFNADESTSLVDTKDGKGYISSGGEVWQNVEKTHNSNLCIKVYSKNR